MILTPGERDGMVPPSLITAPTVDICTGWLRQFCCSCTVDNVETWNMASTWLTAFYSYFLWGENAASLNEQEITWQDNLSQICWPPTRRGQSEHLDTICNWSKASLDTLHKSPKSIRGNPVATFTASGLQWRAWPWHLEHFSPRPPSPWEHKLQTSWKAYIWSGTITSETLWPFFRFLPACKNWILGHSQTCERFRKI